MQSRFCTDICRLLDQLSPGHASRGIPLPVHVHSAELEDVNHIFAIPTAPIRRACEDEPHLLQEHHES